ncbi:hypothetical protein EVAR_80321_1 [Eumeta japonica]|uniref:Uncharacterized protein n=1 Tax=Eumeta variegata TaxID=151549 RepID=A0A4C1UCQ0_EUMVA|nr:hypothetical protein EVAR_80321_1 [Eumeta japonica]
MDAGMHCATNSVSRCVYNPLSYPSSSRPRGHGNALRLFSTASEPSSFPLTSSFCRFNSIKQNSINTIILSNKRPPSNSAHRDSRLRNPTARVVRHALGGAFNLIRTLPAGISAGGGGAGAGVDSSLCGCRPLTNYAGGRRLRAAITDRPAPDCLLCCGFCYAYRCVLRPG